MVKIGMTHNIGGVPARLRGFQSSNIERLTLIGVWRTMVEDSKVIRMCRDEGWVIPKFMVGTGETVLVPISDPRDAVSEAKLRLNGILARTVIKYRTKSNT